MTRRWNQLSTAQVHAARKFSSQVPGLSISQAAKHLDECFVCLRFAQARGITFRNAWEHYDEALRAEKEAS